MPRKSLMSYDGKNRAWVKMFKGVRYRIQCSDLHPTDTTKVGTYQLANDWWLRKHAELLPPPLTVIDKLKESLRKARPTQTEEQLNDFVTWLTDAQIDPSPGQLALNLLSVGSMPRELVEAVLGKQHAQQIEDAIDGKKDALTPTINDAIEEFVKIWSTRMKPRTAIEMVTIIRRLQQDNLTFDEKGVLAAFNNLNARELASAGKRKIWSYYKRLVTFVAEQGIIAIPTNLNSGTFKFKVKLKKIKSYPTNDVKSAIAAIQDEKIRLFAILGLNCGMTNTDIGELLHSQVDGGYLTRKRIKTEDNANVPTVTYKLWAETARLLAKYKSKHKTHWFVSSTGTPLVETGFVNGKGKAKDLIHRRFKNSGCPISLRDFRKIASTQLDKHENFGRYGSYFLAHSPASMKDRFYSVPSQDIFDKAIDWLGAEFGY